MCCCKYLHNQTSCPLRQASSDGERARLNCGGLWGRGEHPSPYKCCLPAASALRNSLQGTWHEPIELVQAEYTLVCIEYMWSTCYFDPALRQWWYILHAIIQLNLKSYITFSNNNDTATKNSKGNKWNDDICQFSSPWFRQIHHKDFCLSHLYV